uniref:Uncharacterized protein n=1 Tax=Strombidinopsis acuminata TaxID=141414 RepID=A0A7S3TP27_9SPIT
MQRTCLVLIALVGAAGALKVDSSPDVSAQVAEEARENIQIHDGFLSQEQKDAEEVKAVKANKALSALDLRETVAVQGLPAGEWTMALDKGMKTQMLVQVKTPVIKDPCGGITCGALTCPGGFAVTEVEGHCCPYCVNPAIKVESAITGATGSAGGKASTFCQDVWCFPTMCAKAIANPSASNGQCCPVCPAL